MYLKKLFSLGFTIIVPCIGIAFLPPDTDTPFRVLAGLGASALILVVAGLPKNDQSQYIQDFIKELMEGNVTARPDRRLNDTFLPIADRILEMNHQIKGMMGRILITSEKIFDTIHPLRSKSESLAFSFEDVAVNVGTIAESVDMVSMKSAETRLETAQLLEDVNRIEAYANETSDLAANMSQDFEKSRVETESMVHALKDISSNISAVAVGIGELQLEMKQIEDVISFITAVAGKTNLLALNASIEAARAGDAGRGFAVVAEEVRVLAEQSNESSDQIRNRINSIRDKMDTLTTTVQLEAQKSIEAANHADTTLSTLQVLSGSVLRTQSAIHEIQELTGAQKSMSTHVYELVDVIAQSNMSITGNTEATAAITQEQAISLAEMAAVVYELNQISDDLQQVTSQYKSRLTIGGEKKLLVDKTLQEMKRYLGEHPCNDLSRFTYDLLRQLRFNTDSIDLVAAVEANGFTHAWSLDEKGQGVDVRFRPFYKTAIQGKDYISEPYISQATQEFCITLATPVFSQGTVIGVFVVDLSL